MSYVVYVAEPIDQATNGLAHQWTCPDEWTLYRPSRAFSRPFDPNLDAVNRSVLATVDGVLAFLPRGVPSIGVPAEIEWALLHDLPVGIVSDVDESVALRGFAARGAIVGSDPMDVVEWLEIAMRDQPRSDEISFVRVHQKAVLPVRGYVDDVGLDLYASVDMTIPVMQFRDVPSGVIANIPTGSWGYITTRSSTMRKYRLWVTPGVIDPSFRGELFVGVWNVGGATHQVRAGDRLGQMILLPALCPQPIWADDIVPGMSDRGERGFGSTGA
ncbi:MAG TPA: hypothetical protein VJW23_14280 [Propionibacteriaceae bacterium]|nr:hypothetical protein [Propionibacteriaceae bacterium]